MAETLGTHSSQQSSGFAESVKIGSYSATVSLAVLAVDDAKPLGNRRLLRNNAAMVL